MFFLHVCASISDPACTVSYERQNIDPSLARSATKGGRLADSRVKRVNAPGAGASINSRRIRCDRT